MPDRLPANERHAQSDDLRGSEEIRTGQRWRCVAASEPEYVGGEITIGELFVLPWHRTKKGEPVPVRAIIDGDGRYILEDDLLRQWERIA